MRINPALWVDALCVDRPNAQRHRFPDTWYQWCSACEIRISKRGKDWTEPEKRGILEASKSLEA